MANLLSPQAVISRKRDGNALSRDEIAAFVQGAAQGGWSDDQCAALLMAIFLRGMTPEETAALTELMMRSGAVADLRGIPGIKVDKHSTGGVGDKVSLVLAPLAAACGVCVPMMSGRGLGHTGGTLDKLEAIPGFRVSLGLDAYAAQLRKLGVAMIGQTAELVPADRRLYALRDATATVESIPLICASILSKKLAEGIDALVLDVKFGRGAFMKEHARAQELASGLVTLGKAMGKPTRALLTSMDQPLGRTVGNAVEVVEAIDCLRGKGPADLRDVTMALGVHMLLLARIDTDRAAARRRLDEAIADGSALRKFRDLIAAQGGDPAVVDDPGRLPQAPFVGPVPAGSSGFVVDVDPMAIALAAWRLGAGRAHAADPVDPAVGLTALVKSGEPVAAGAPLCMAHARSEKDLRAVMEQISTAFTIGAKPPAPGRLIDELIE